MTAEPCSRGCCDTPQSAAQEPSLSPVSYGTFQEETGNKQQRALQAHRHGPDCGHVVVHHYSTEGQSHFAFINADSTTDCFEVSIAENGCCNMALTMTDSCTIESFLPTIDADGSKMEEKISETETEVLDENEKKKVATGDRVAVFLDEGKKVLVFRDEDKTEVLGVLNSHTQQVTVCPSLLLDTARKLEGNSSALQQDSCDSNCCASPDQKPGTQADSKKQNESTELCCAASLCGRNISEVNGFRETFYPSVCTGLWENLFHASTCEASVGKHAVFPMSSVLAKKSNEKSTAAGAGGMTTTLFHINDMCCAMEGQLAQACLEKQPGLQSLSVNVTFKRLTVVHDPTMLSSATILSLLKTQNLSAAIFDSAVEQESSAEIEGLDGSRAPSRSAKYLSWFRDLKLNVSIALVFLLLSLLSYIENLGNLEYLALISVALCLPNVLRKSVGRLRKGYLDITTLMSLASLGGIALQKFSEAGAVITLYSLSEWLEAVATTRIRTAVEDLVRLRPKTARLVSSGERAQWNQVTVVKVETVEIGHVVEVRVGDPFPVDGKVVFGSTLVDESPLTGEPMPIKKSAEDSVFSGTINLGPGLVQVEATSKSAQSVVAKMLKLVEEATANKSTTEQYVEQVARVYTPVVFVVSILLATIPWLYGVEVGKEFTNYALVLLVVGCPCALVISTPITYVAGLAQAARQGILIKGGTYLETLANLDIICFDKTGTLTKGRFDLLQTMMSETLNSKSGSLTLINSTQDVIDVVQLIEASSSHPIALSLCNSLQQNLEVQQLAQKATSSQAIESLLVDSEHTFKENAFEILELNTVKGKGVCAKLAKVFVNVMGENSATDRMLSEQLQNQVSTLRLVKIQVQLTRKTGELQAGRYADEIGSLLLEHLEGSQMLNVTCLQEKAMLEYTVLCKEASAVPSAALKEAILKITGSLIEVTVSLETETAEVELCSDLCCNKETSYGKANLSSSLEVSNGMVSVDDGPSNGQEADCAKGCCSTPSVSKTAQRLGGSSKTREGLVCRYFLDMLDDCSREDIRLIENSLRNLDKGSKVEASFLGPKQSSKPKVILSSTTAFPLTSIQEQFEVFGIDIAVEKISVEELVYVGNVRLANDFLHGLTSLPSQQDSVENDFLQQVVDQTIEGSTVCVFGIHSQPLAAFMLGDEIREEALQLVEEVKKLGIEMKMLTGDNEKSAAAVCKRLGLSSFAANLLPEEKLAELERLKAGSTKQAVETLFEDESTPILPLTKRKRPIPTSLSNPKVVAMIGDGINDALSLACADVSLSLGESATTLAVETADVTLIEDNLLKVVDAINLGRKSKRKIVQNVVFSVLLKLLVVAITFGVPFPNLWLAILSDVGAMLLVTLNSISLISPRRKRRVGYHNGE